MKRLISLILAFVLIFSFGVSAFAEWDYVDANNLSSIASYISLLSRYNATASNQTSIFNLLNTTVSTRLYNIDTDLSNIYSRVGTIRDLVSSIEEVIADEDDLQAKEASRDNQQSFTSEFLSGSNSVSTSNIGALSGLGTSFKDFFSMTGAGGGSAEVDISSWSDILVDDEPFTFFTEADSIAESMGVEAGGFVPNPDVGGGGGGGDEPDEPYEPDNPPTPQYSSYVVHYYLQGTTQSLADDKTVNNVEVGTSVTETALPITGYDVVGSNSQTITIAQSGNVITFYYTLHIDYSSYTVYYYVENTTTQLSAPKSVTNVVVGSQVTENAIPIDNYTLVGDSSQTITIAQSGNVITFYYRLNDVPEPEPEYASYTVHYYKQGTTISVRDDKIVNNVEVGTSVTENAPSVTGYTLVGDSSQTFTVIITGNVITFYYTPVIVYSSYTVHYYKTGTTTKVQADKTVNNVEVGTSVTETAPSVSGYTLNGSGSKTITIVNGSNVITFYYNEIVVRHYLTYSGNFHTPTRNPILNSTDFSTSHYVSSGYELHDGDVIRVRASRTAQSNYSVVYNGVTYYYDSSSVTFDIYQSDIVFMGSSSSSSSAASSSCTLTFIYHDSPAPLHAPLRMLRSSPVDTSNQVVTHYYQDNLNKLFGFLRGD